MKTLKILALLLVIYLFSSCQKEACQNMAVLHNCTGSYLTIEDKNYLICNKDVVANYENGAKVHAKVDYINWEACDNTWIACFMAFPHEGVIQVNTIRPK